MPRNLWFAWNYSQPSARVIHPFSLTHLWEMMMMWYCVFILFFFFFCFSFRFRLAQSATSYIGIDPKIKSEQKKNIICFSHLWHTIDGISFVDRSRVWCSHIFISLCHFLCKPRSTHSASDCCWVMCWMCVVFYWIHFLFLYAILMCFFFLFVSVYKMFLWTSIVSVYSPLRYTYSSWPRLRCLNNLCCHRRRFLLLYRSHRYNGTLRDDSLWSIKRRKNDCMVSSYR